MREGKTIYRLSGRPGFVRMASQRTPGVLPQAKSPRHCAKHNARYSCATAPDSRFIGMMKRPPTSPLTCPSGEQVLSLNVYVAVFTVRKIVSIPQKMSNAGRIIFTEISIYLALLFHQCPDLLRLPVKMCLDMHDQIAKIHLIENIFQLDSAHHPIKLFDARYTLSVL